jgi:integrase
MAPVEYQDFSINPLLQNVFEDFEPPPTTDGTYMGTMKQVNATQKHLQLKFEQELENAKGRLKAAKIKVGLTVLGGSIQLQASLPLKPGDEDIRGKGTKQYKISLAIPANLDGLKTAEEEAYELGRLIARKQFIWNDKYLGKQATNASKESRTIGEFLEKFEHDYFKDRKRTIKSETTFSGYIKILKMYASTDKLATAENLLDDIRALQSEWRKYSFAKALAVFCKIYDISIDLKEYRRIPESSPRYIPTDKEVEDCFHNYQQHAQEQKKSRHDAQDNWKFWRWFYAMLATYGLRPREIFLNPDINHWLSAENKDNTWKVDKECKTGAREVLPLYPEWVEKFDLKNIECLEILIKKIDNCQNFSRLGNLVENNAQWFRKVQMPFKPYDLRHAWAIRAHLNGISIKVAADNLGHSVDMHTKVYQKWFSLDNRKQMMQQALTKKNELEVLKEENQLLKQEIQSLKFDNKRLVEELMYSQDLPVVIHTNK